MKRQGRKRAAAGLMRGSSLPSSSQQLQGWSFRALPRNRLDLHGESSGTSPLVSQAVVAGRRVHRYAVGDEQPLPESC